ncbi:condensation domain-containing protein [Streptomyces sp. NBC_01244]|uniref:condensation domain-containing protein n=1 Tax=Streptomyces sp. NBC_01244 TaxID=2903797 RepID=UPI002E118A67|nr:condensation domain-containing protein [Streptomyces sp. NBC_01244]
MAQFFPLSEEQTSLLFLDRLFGPGIFHNNNYTLRLDAETFPKVSYDDVRAAVTDLLESQEALRTGLVAGSPFVQELGPPEAHLTSRTVYDEAPSAYTDRRAGELHNAELHPREVPARARFEYAEDPAGQHKALLIATDHLVSDGISSGLVRSRLHAYLQARQNGEKPPASEPAGYAALCRDRHPGTEAQAREVAHWNRKLGNVEPLRGLAATPRGDLQRTQVDRGTAGPARYDEVNLLTGRYEASPFAVVATLVGCALWRRTGRRRFLLHTPMSTRRDESAQAAVGYFVNDRPVLCEVDPDQPLADAFRAMMAAAWNAGRHSTLSVPRLAAEVPAYGASLLEPGIDYVQLHVWMSQVPSNRYRGPVDWREEIVHGPFRPARDLRVTTLRYRFCPQETFDRTFFAGPADGIHEATAVSDDVLTLLRAAAGTEVSTIGALAQTLRS